jgi:hypothetical protein
MELLREMKERGDAARQLVVLLEKAALEDRDAATRQMLADEATVLAIRLKQWEELQTLRLALERDFTQEAAEHALKRLGEQEVRCRDIVDKLPPVVVRGMPGLVVYPKRESLDRATWRLKMINTARDAMEAAVRWAQVSKPEEDDEPEHTIVEGTMPDFGSETYLAKNLAFHFVSVFEDARQQAGEYEVEMTEDEHNVFLGLLAWRAEERARAFEVDRNGEAVWWASRRSSPEELDEAKKAAVDAQMKRIAQAREQVRQFSGRVLAARRGEPLPDAPMLHEQPAAQIPGSRPLHVRIKPFEPGEDR